MMSNQLPPHLIRPHATVDAASKAKQKVAYRSAQVAHLAVLIRKSRNLLIRPTLQKLEGTHRHRLPLVQLRLPLLVLAVLP